MKASEVFVPGGQPLSTYVARDELHLERKVLDYLDEGHRMLSIAGPTKSGKTVLIRRIMPDAVWIAGGGVRNMDDFWASAVDKLGIYLTEAKERTSSEAESAVGTAKAGISALVEAGGELSTTYASESGKRQSFERTRRAMDIAINRLVDRNLVLVIDDFHYLDQSVQRDLVRSLKEPIYNGLRVIVAAVPHRATDAVRVETEMTGRVEHLLVPPWSAEDLADIATRGFAALNLSTKPEFTVDVARNSFGSPHLTQDLCLQLCKANGVSEASEHPVSISFPLDAVPKSPRRGADAREAFFRSRSPDTARVAFEMLLQGPRQRTDRKPRVLKDSTETDIYGAVLAAIANAGAKPQIPMREIQEALRRVMAEQPPQRQEVARVLEKMTEIARTKIPGVPVLEYVDASETLFISDPFFAYFLRWGGQAAELTSRSLNITGRRRGGRGGRKHQRRKPA